MYDVRILRRAIKDIAQLPKEYSRRVSKQIDGLADDPRPPNAKKLTNQPGYRLRVGPYRILYTIDDKANLVTIYRVKHRREAYR
jgi:mRNA interferase RelE/StbE